MTLPEYIDSKLKTQFSWGVNDCMTFTIGWVEEITGKKYLPSKIWNNKTQALRTIKANGGLEKVFDNNFNRVKPAYANDGDICCIGNTAGIISGRNVLTMEEEKGFVSLPRYLVVNAWSIK